MDPVEDTPVTSLDKLGNISVRVRPPEMGQTLGWGLCPVKAMQRGGFGTSGWKLETPQVTNKAACVDFKLQQPLEHTTHRDPSALASLGRSGGPDRYALP